MKYSALAAWAQGFLLPTLFRRDPAGQNRPRNDRKALVGFQQNPQHAPVLQWWGSFIVIMGSLCLYNSTFEFLSESHRVQRELNFTYKEVGSDKTAVIYFLNVIRTLCWCLRGSCGRNVRDSRENYFWWLVFTSVMSVQSVHIIKNNNCLSIKTIPVLTSKTFWWNVTRHRIITQCLQS